MKDKTISEGSLINESEIYSYQIFNPFDQERQRKSY